MLMHNPPHPGLLIRRMLIEGAGLSVTEAAERLGITRVMLSKLLNARANISPEMAVRLSMALNTSSEMWLSMQAMYDLWHAEKKRKKLHIKPIQLVNAYA
jgi:addiction module HigA family antidote